MAAVRRIGCLWLAAPAPEAGPALREVALRHCPRVEEAAPGRLYLDLAGLERLHGSEPGIAERLRRAAGEAGLDVRVGIASTRLGALWAARRGAGIAVVAPGEEARHLAEAPLALLECPPETAARIGRWGIRTLGELAALPPAALHERLGEEGLRLRRLARGEDDRPLGPWRPPEVFEESAEPGWAVDALEPLLSLVDGLLDRLCARLVRRGLAADRVEWSLGLAGGGVHEGGITPAVPASDPAALRPLLRASLESHRPRGAVEAATLRAHPARVSPAQGALGERSRPSPRLVAAALGRLAALVGARQLGVPVLLDSHRPDAVRLDPPPLHLHPGPLPGRERDAPAPGRDGEPSSRSPSGGSGQGDGERRPALAFRRLRPPRPAGVTLLSGRPVHLRSAELTGRIVTGSGPWRSAGEWWTPGPWLRDEWDVELADGTVCRLASDGSAWWLDGVYD